MGSSHLMDTVSVLDDKQALETDVMIAQCQMS